MSLVSTKTPIFDDIPSIEFFNGRLLSGEDMTTEQAWNAARRKLLGQALGSGVAFGLEVRISEKSEHAGKPIVTVDPGLALNADGVALSLADPTDVSLAQVDETEAVPAEFSTCLPTQYSAYVKADGVYLLTLCPAAGTQGRAPVSGLANQEARCNRKYRREGVQFRLHQLKLTAAELADRNRLRNLVAYKCFNPDVWQAFVTDPFAAPATRPKLLDGLLVPKLEDSEVPLATVFWTTDGGIEYVDLWSVRRPLASRDEGGAFASLFADDRIATGQAMIHQFQAQIANLLTRLAVPTNLMARDHFRWLPPVGFLPLAGPSPHGVSVTTFFRGLTVRYPRMPVFGPEDGPVFMDGARLSALLRAAPHYPPVDVSGSEALWLYRVRENRIARDKTPAAAGPAVVIFANAQLPYYGSPRLDVSHYNYANYSSVLFGPGGI